MLWCNLCLCASSSTCSFQGTVAVRSWSESCIILLWGEIPAALGWAVNVLTLAVCFTLCRHVWFFKWSGGFISPYRGNPGSFSMCLILQLCGCKTCLTIRCVSAPCEDFLAPVAHVPMLHQPMCSVNVCLRLPGWFVLGSCPAVHCCWLENIWSKAQTL